MGLKVKMKVGAMDVKYDVHDELYFDPEHVFDVIGEQASKLAWWSSLVVMKEQELADEQVRHERRTAEVDTAIRAQAVDTGTKVTETAIKSMIAQNDEIHNGSLKINKLKRDVGFLKAMAMAFKDRSALLATSGSAQRAELEARLRSMVKSTSKESK
jgi:hypothetical protein